MIADICVFACTGHAGAAVASRIVELADAPLTLLLAGRNVEKVQDLRTKLMKQARSDSKVTILVHPEAVDVADDDDMALLQMVSRARVVTNCTDVDCHPRALEGVAEACIKAGVHYLDLAPRQSQIQSCFGLVLHREPLVKSIVVPACGFDYAFMDVAVYEAEKQFEKRHAGCKPDNVQLTLAVRTGPLGMKWPLRLVNAFQEPQSKSAPSSAPSKVSRVAARQSRSKSPILSFISALSSWSIPWPLGADAMTFLLCQRHWVPEAVDARLALPRQLWKALFLAVYGFVAAAFLVPLATVARYLKVGMLQRFVLWLVPYASLGFFSDDNDLCVRSIEQMRIEFVVSLTSNKGQSLCYHVTGPSPELLNPLCLALASMELASSNDVGAQTPAMAMGETDFWNRLQNACDVKVQITDCKRSPDGTHQD